jgi:dihydroorotase
VSRLLIRNGRVVDPSQSLDQGMDILIADGLIADLGERLDVDSSTAVVDAAGLVVAPGFIDVNAHLREPGAEHKETIESACRAAVRGGFTAVCSMADTDPVNDDPAVTRYICERAARIGLARVFPVGAVTEGLGGQELAEMGEMARAGAVAVSDDGHPVTDAQVMRRALEYARSFDLRVVSHPVDPVLAGGGCMHEGEVSTRIGLAGIPAAAEEAMVARDTLLAELTEGRLHLGHLSTAGSLDMVRTAKRKGIDVTCDVTAHHFTLTETDVARSNYHPNWKTDPPLRSAADVEAVLQAIYDGTVDCIASNHSPQHADDKELDFSIAPAGVVGLETTVSLAIERLIHGRIIGVSQLVRLLSTRPAEVFGLPGGAARTGSVADLTLLDLRRHHTVDPASFASLASNTPFAGLRLRGGAAATIVGGRVVWSSLDRIPVTG